MPRRCRRCISSSDVPAATSAMPIKSAHRRSKPVNGSVPDLLVVSVFAATPLVDVEGVEDDGALLSSFDGDVPFVGVVGVVGVVAGVVGVVGVVGGGVVVVVVVGVVLYPDRPSLAASADVGITRPALTISASG